LNKLRREVTVDGSRGS